MLFSYLPTTFQDIYTYAFYCGVEDPFSVYKAMPRQKIPFSDSQPVRQFVEEPTLLVVELDEDALDFVEYLSMKVSDSI